MLTHFFVKFSAEFLLVQARSEHGNANIVLILFQLLHQVGVDEESGSGVVQLEGLPHGFHFAVLVCLHCHLRQLLARHRISRHFEVVIQSSQRSSLIPRKMPQ